MTISCRSSGRSIGMCAASWLLRLEPSSWQDQVAFYKSLIKTADKRFDGHLKKLANATKESS